MIRLYLRAAAFAVALFALYVCAEPAYVAAQSSSAQQVEIGDLERRAGANDALVQTLENREARDAAAISEIEGETRVFFGVLSVLTGGSFVGQIVVQISDNRRKHRA